jgi:hypothetical protein
MTTRQSSRLTVLGTPPPHPPSEKGVKISEVSSRAQVNEQPIRWRRSFVPLAKIGRDFVSSLIYGTEPLCEVHSVHPWRAKRRYVQTLYESMITAIKQRGHT